ncbi:TetR/AcrR family transcriptional regulator [Microbacterium rhizophilus]|uniref:TetR/AcrR family transcriptional regulator n=1 Tax=Microbacterium rhizophilus TaxID=3138934 RepID=UPI0031F112C7
MPQPRRESARDRTRRRIALAARAEALEVGYDALSVDAIATRAGVSRATYYLHFRNKLEALSAALRYDVRPSMDELLARLDALCGVPERDALRQWVDDAVSFWQASADAVEVSEQVLTLDAASTPTWIAMNQHAVHALPNLSNRWQGHDVEVVRARVGLLFMQLDRACFFHNRDALPFDRSTLIDALVEEWWSLLRRQPTRSAP